MSRIRDIPSFFSASSTPYTVGDAYLSASSPLYRAGDATTVESNTRDVVLDSCKKEGITRTRTIPSFLIRLIS